MFSMSPYLRISSHSFQMNHSVLLMPTADTTREPQIYLLTTPLCISLYHFALTKCHYVLIESCCIQPYFLWFFLVRYPGWFPPLLRLWWIYIWGPKVIVQPLTVIHSLSAYNKTRSTLWIQVHDRFPVPNTHSPITNFHSQNISFIIWPKSPILIIFFLIWCKFLFNIFHVSFLFYDLINSF